MPSLPRNVPTALAASEQPAPKTVDRPTIVEYSEPREPTFRWDEWFADGIEYRGWKIKERVTFDGKAGYLMRRPDDWRFGSSLTLESAYRSIDIHP